MSKRLILVLALAFIASTVALAYAEVQNVKISGDLLVEGLGRNNIMLRKNDNNWPNQDVYYNQYDHRIYGLLSHIRVRIDADLTDNVTATVRLLNERPWGEENDTTTASRTEINLDLAYVALKEFLYSPLTLTIGRQELMFGNGFVMGDPDTTNLSAGHGLTAASTGQYLPRSLDDLSVRKAFDAVRATLNYDPLVIDAVYAMMDRGPIDRDHDTSLYGVNANYALDQNTTLEGYYWQRVRSKAGGSTSNPAGSGATVQGINNSRDDWTGTIGGRVQNTSIKNLLVGLEAAWQIGDHVRNTTLYPNDASNDQSVRHRKAYALQMITKYDLSEMVGKYNPSVGVQYTLLSGDPWQKNTNTYRGWDPMYYNQGQGKLYNKILGHSNCQVVNVNGAMKPLDDVTLAFDISYIRLMRPFRDDAGVSPNYVNLTGIPGDPTYSMKPNKYTLGTDYEATVTYDYTEDVQFALNLGAFVPGGAFSESNENTATQCIGSMKVTF